MPLRKVPPKLIVKEKGEEEDYEPYMGNIILCEKPFVPDQSPDWTKIDSQEDDENWDFEHRDTW